MKTGRKVYDDLMTTYKNQDDNPKVSINIDIYGFENIPIILPKNHQQAEVNLMDSILMEETSYLVAKGITSCNDTNTDKPDYFQIEASQGNEFKTIFPGYIILSAAFEEEEYGVLSGECFLIDANNENYPVLFFGMDGVTYVTDDLETFIENHIIFD